MKEILLLNLTRMGDILQKTPLVLGLRRKYPGARITVAVNKDFAAVCEGMPFVDRLVTWDKRALLQVLQQEDASPVDKYRALEDALAPLREVHYDLAFNLSHSRLSALLLHVIRAREVRGITMDPEGYRIIRHPWMNYFFCAVVNRRMNTFNLVDMYKKADALPEDAPRNLVLEVPEAASAWADAVLREHGVQKDEPLIALQPGASQANRCWPPEAYAALADRLIEEHGARILIVGGPGEKALGEAIGKRMKGDALDLTGRTTVMQVCALLARCRVLVCPDTGPMHLATAVGTRVVALFMSTAYYPETGPYGEGHYVLQADLPCLPCHFLSTCHHRVCRDAIRVEAVAQAVALALSEPRSLHGLGANGRDGGGSPAPASLPDGPPWQGLCLLRSEFDTDGMLCYRPLIRRAMDPAGFWALLYRALWRRTLDGPRRSLGEECRILARWSEAVWEITPRSLEAVEGPAGELRHLHALAQQGQSLAQALLEALSQPGPPVARIRELGERLEALDQDIKRLGQATPELGPLTTMFQFGKENLEAAPVAVLAARTLALYRDLAQRAEELEALLRGVTARWGGSSRGDRQQPLAVGVTEER